MSQRTRARLVHTIMLVLDILNRNKRKNWQPIPFVVLNRSNVAGRSNYRNTVTVMARIGLWPCREQKWYLIQISDYKFFIWSIGTFNYYELDRITICTRHNVTHSYRTQVARHNMIRNNDITNRPQRNATRHNTDAIIIVTKSRGGKLISRTPSVNVVYILLYRTYTSLYSNTVRRCYYCHSFSPSSGLYVCM